MEDGWSLQEPVWPSVCVYARAHWTLPGAGLTSTRLLPTESCSPSRQWPADSIGGQMAMAATGLRLNWTDFHLTFDLRGHRSWINSISLPGCGWLMRGGSKQQQSAGLTSHDRLEKLPRQSAVTWMNNSPWRTKRWSYKEGLMVTKKGSCHSAG